MAIDASSLIIYSISQIPSSRPFRNIEGKFELKCLLMKKLSGALFGCRIGLRGFDKCERLGEQASATLTVRNCEASLDISEGSN